ncbi:transporter substrate-binding domain-containing protein [Marinobacteraceae bacterium S3BR75-40.1]
MATTKSGRALWLWLLLWVPAVLLAQPAPLKFNIAPGGYPPYTLEQSVDDHRGLLFDVVKAFADHEGLRLEVTEIPSKRVENFLLTGHIHASPHAIEWTRNPQRFLFSKPIVWTHDVLIRRADRPLNVSRVADLTDMTVVTQLGFSYPKLDDQVAAGKLQRLDVQHEQEVLSRVLHGYDIGGGILDVRVARWLIREHHEEGNVLLYDLDFPRTAFRIKFGPQWQERVEAFNRDLDAMRQSGRLQELIDYYR